LAKAFDLAGGFRCAEVDDPIAFAAAWPHRCTRCSAVDSQATFSVCCSECKQQDDTFSGWWCTRCVAEASKPRDRQGHHVPLRFCHREGTCQRCAEPAVMLWPEQAIGEGKAQKLCNEHAADRLLSEAAHSCAAGGREPTEGPSLALNVELRLEVEVEDDDLERRYCAKSLEREVLEALSLEGAPPDSTQLHVSCINAGESSSTVVQLAMFRAFGLPAPYELYLRLRSLSTDYDGPLYTAGKYKLLSALRAPPQLLEYVVTNKAELVTMTASTMRVAGENWPRGGAAVSEVALVVRPQQVLLPRAAIVSLRCLNPPAATKGQLMAYALAFPAGSSLRAPTFEEFQSFLDPRATAAGSKDSASTSCGARQRSPSLQSIQKIPSSSSSRSDAVVQRSPAGLRRSASVTHTKPTREVRPTSAQTLSLPEKGGPPKQRRRFSAFSDKCSKEALRGLAAMPSPESGCAVRLAPGSGGGLEGEATLLDLKPGLQYQVFVAVFDTTDATPAAEKEPIVNVHRTLRTCAEPARIDLFDADADGIVQLQTEEPGVARKACFLQLLGLRGAPVIVDQESFEIKEAKDSKKDRDSKEAKAAEKNAGAVKEHGLKVALEAPGESAEDAAWGGGLAVPCAVLKAKPTYREAVAEVSFVASGDVLVNPCKEHSVAGALQRPTAVSVGGRLTEAQCCKPQGQGDGRCRACRWKKVKHPHTVKVRIIIDIIRMAEIRDWASVNKRITITTPADARGAVAVLLNARPHLETDMIMKIFEGACGHQGEVDFPVRVDGATALHVAVEESHHAAVQSLLKRNLDPLVRNSAGETPLHAAARGGLASAPQIAQLLLDSARCAWRGEDKHEDDMQAARKSLLDAQDAQGRTVLHLAATSDQQSLLTMLLKLKADPKLRNKAGGTALHAAAASGGLACLTELLGDKAVDVNLAMGEEKDLGATALHLACQRCHTEVAELLLSKGASARKVTKAGSVEQQALNLLMEGATSFARPSDIHGVVAVAKRLLKGGGTPKDVVTAAGKTLCSLALWGSGDASASEAASELLALLGSAGLDRAEALGAELLNVCRLELTRGTQGDKRDDRRLMLAQTPGAAASDLPDAVALALRLGADPNTADAMKDTALHILLQYPMKRRMLPSDRAAGEAVACAVQKLLERRAEVTAANKKGGTPLALAKRLSELGSHYGNSWAALMAGEPQTPPPAPRRQTHTESKGATDAESASKAEAASSAASEASASRTKSHPSHSREVPKSSMLPSLSLSPNGSPKTSPQPTAREKLPSVVQLPVLGPSIGNAQSPLVSAKKVSAGARRGSLP